MPATEWSANVIEHVWTSEETGATFTVNMNPSITGDALTASSLRALMEAGANVDIDIHAGKVRIASTGVGTASGWRYAGPLRIGDRDVDNVAGDVTFYGGDGPFATFPCSNLVGATVAICEVAGKTIYTVTGSGPWTQLPLLGGETVLTSFGAGGFVGHNAAGLGGSLDASEPATSLLPISKTVDPRVPRYLPDPGTGESVHTVRQYHVTYDDSVPRDGSATHLGGDRIADGNPVLIASGGPNAGVYRAHRGSAWERYDADSVIGTLLDSDIRNGWEYISTSTGWSAQQKFAIVLDGSGFHTLSSLIPITQNFRASVIATDVSGDTVTVLEKDGTPSTLSIAGTSDLFSVLNLDGRTLLTVEDGEVKQTESVSSLAITGQWKASGIGAQGIGTCVAQVNGHFSYLTTAPGGGGAGVPAIDDEGADEGRALTVVEGQAQWHRRMDGTFIPYTSNGVDATVDLGSDWTHQRIEVRDVNGYPVAGWRISGSTLVWDEVPDDGEQFTIVITEVIGA
jgi:hypothetical protein